MAYWLYFFCKSLGMTVTSMFHDLTFSWTSNNVKSRELLIYSHLFEGSLNILVGLIVMSSLFDILMFHNYFSLLLRSGNSFFCYIIFYSDLSLQVCALLDIELILYLILEPCRFMNDLMQTQQQKLMMPVLIILLKRYVFWDL